MPPLPQSATRLAVPAPALCHGGLDAGTRTQTTHQVVLASRSNTTASSIFGNHHRGRIAGYSRVHGIVGQNLESLFALFLL